MSEPDPLEALRLSTLKDVQETRMSRRREMARLLDDSLDALRLQRAKELMEGPK